MGVGTAIHYVGSFLLLAATIFLVVVSITSPVINDLALFSVSFNQRIGNAERLTFGTFGYCVINAQFHDQCVHHLGYYPTNIISNYTTTPFSHADRTSTGILTHVFILHPIAAGLAFLAFVLSLATNVVTSLASSLLTFVAFVATIIVLGCDFATFALIKNHVDDQWKGSRAPASAHWGRVIWLVVAAAASSLVATVLVFFTCLANRRKSGGPRGSFAKHG